LAVSVGDVGEFIDEDCQTDEKKDGDFEEVGFHGDIIAQLAN